MPITTTITSTDYWTAATRETITSTKWNAHMSIYRGHLLPVDGSTSAAANGSYDLGSTDHKWRNVHATTFVGKPGYAFSTITAALSITSQHVILCDASTAAYTCTLPAAANNTGTTFLFTKVDSGFNIVTIDGNGAEQINDTATTNIATYGEMLEVICDGVKWYKKSRYIDERWNTFTPTGNLTTNVTFFGSWRRQGPEMEIRTGIRMAGAITTTSIYIYQPANSPALDTSKIPGYTTTGYYVFGYGTCGDQGNGYYEADIALFNTTSGYAIGNIQTGSTWGQAGLASGSQPFTWGAGDFLECTYKVPITGWEA